MNDFPWSKFDGRTFVDCAGGQGSLSVLLSEMSVSSPGFHQSHRFLPHYFSLPQSRFIVQDLPEVVATTQGHLARMAPIAAETGRITTEAADLFDRQPRYGDGFIYLLRHTL